MKLDTPVKSLFLPGVHENSIELEVIRVGWKEVGISGSPGSILTMRSYDALPQPLQLRPRTRTA